MMKLLTITVPCYNSEAYMDRCIRSLLPGGEDVEILIVDDGSARDRTGEIADAYAERYPSVVRAIHQENKGHGGAVNTGIENARGMFFKVVDSDDWLDESAYQKVLDTLRNLVQEERNVDAVFSNYVYEKVGQSRKRVMRYRYFFPENQIFTWGDMHRLAPGKYILMHSIIYRTEVLRESGLRLPEHTFYVDNLYAYIPMAHVRTMYYIDANLYRYYIGREDQSVNETVMCSRIDQQIRVNNIMIDFMGTEGKKLRGNQWHFIMHSLSIIMTISSILLIRIGTKEALQMRKDLWFRLKKTDMGAYLRIRFGILGVTMNLPGKPGRRFSTRAYELARKFYGFN